MTDDQLRAAFGGQTPNVTPENQAFLHRLEGKLGAEWSASEAAPRVLADGRAGDDLDTAHEHNSSDGLDIIDIGVVTTSESSRHGRRRRRITAGVTFFTAAAVVAGVVYVRRDAHRKPLTIAAINAATDEAGTARFLMQMQSSIGERSASKTALTMKYEGVIDFTHDVGDFTMTFDGNPYEAIPELEHAVKGQNEDPPSMRMIWKGNDQWMLSKGMFDGLGSDGKKWMHNRIDDKQVADGGAFFSIMGGTNGGAIDPTALLRQLQTGATLTKLGTEDLRGAATTKFQVTTTRKAIDRSSRSSKEVSFDLWADNAGRLRKIAADSNIAGTMADDLTMEFFDYGVNVDVQPPAKADTIEESDAFTNAGEELPTNGEPTKLTGGWKKIQSGADRGVDWELWMASASQSQVCYSVHSNPKFENSAQSPLTMLNGVSPTTDDSTNTDTSPKTIPIEAGGDVPGSASPRHDDDPSYCTSNVGATSSFGGTEFVFDGANAAVRLLAVVGVASSDVVVTFSDGTTAPATVQDNRLVVVLPSEPSITKIVIGTGDSATVCRPTRSAESQSESAGPIAELASGPFCMPAAFDDQMQGPGKLTGAWSAVRSGNTSGVTWRLMRAPARKDWYCWALTTTPTIDLIESVGMPFSGEPVQYEGTAAVCGTVPAAFDHSPNLMFGQQITTLAESTTTSSPAALVLWLPDGVTQGTITRKDGSTVNADIDVATRTMVYIGTQPIETVNLSGTDGEFECSRPTIEDDPASEAGTEQFPEDAFGSPLQCLPADSNR